MPNRYLFAPLLLTTICCASIRAQQIEPGVQYHGPTTLQAPEYGAAFILPAGWSGMLPPDGDFFVMQSATVQGYIFAGIDELTLTQAQRLMSADINLGDVVLKPAGEVRVDSSRLAAEYSIVGSRTPLVGQVTTIVGDHGYGIFFIAAAAPDGIEPIRAAVGMITASVRLTGPASSGATSTATSDWAEQIGGRKLSHFFTRTGYTEEDYLWLCHDGRFYHSFNSGGFGGGASGAFESKDGGRWEVSGTSEQGALRLAYNDGRTSRITLSVQEEKLYLDGKRYFREATDCR
jgi:hypothetical protein